MSRDFSYRPKFVDIRIRPKGKEEDEAAQDVNALKPGEKRCDWPGCPTAGAARAPKGRDMPGEHYWFCQRHAAEYNKNWNYFSGMSEGQVAAAMEEERRTGGRPTWSFKASNRTREAAAQASKGEHIDPFGFFGTSPYAEQANDGGKQSRPVGKIERKALADMDLEPGAKPEEVRAAYTILIKRLHPDSNGGDRSMEEKLGRVIKAYKTLKAAKLA